MDILKEFLSKEFLSQFKTGEDVSAFMKELHTRVYEQMLEAEMDNLQVMRNTPIKEVIVATPAMVVIGSRFKLRWMNLLFRFPMIRKGEFEPVVVPKHQSRGLSIERLVLSLYAKV